MKQVLTDGREARLLLGITAPEDVDLERCLNPESRESLLFSEFTLGAVTEENSREGSSSRGSRTDGDGKANTINYAIHVTRRSEGISFPKGSQWNLFLEDLQVRQWNRELLQYDTLWQAEGSWSFRLTVEEGQWEELEFIREPITTRAVIGWDIHGNNVWEDVTITSLVLRGFGGGITCLEYGGAELCDYPEGKYYRLVLKDGTVLELLDDLSLVDPEAHGEMIPLGEVDHLLLPDGTKLYPQAANQG